MGITSPGEMSFNRETIYLSVDIKTGTLHKGRY